MSASRSPNYPQIALGEAIERIQRVYKALHTGKASEGRVLELLGYRARSGTAQGVLSGLRKYGLLEGNRNSFQVTKDAVILSERDASHPEYRAALTRAALAPASASLLLSSAPWRRQPAHR